METGTGLMLAGVWFFAGSCGLSKYVSPIAFLFSIIGAIFLTCISI